MSHRIRVTVDGHAFDSIVELAIFLRLPVNATHKALRRVAEAGLAMTSQNLRATIRARCNSKSLTIGCVAYPTIRSAAAAIGMQPETLGRRLKRLARQGKPVTRQAIARAGLPPFSPNARRLRIDGRIFNSIAAAARFFGIEANVFEYRLRRAKETGEALAKWIGKPVRHPLTVELDGRTFKSIHHACKELELSRSELLRRVRAEAAASKAAV